MSKKNFGRGPKDEKEHREEWRRRERGSGKKEVKEKVIKTQPDNTKGTHVASKLKCNK